LTFTFLLHFVFSQKLGILFGHFEKHTHFKYVRKCGEGSSGEVCAYRDEKTDVTFVKKRIKVSDS
jgi:hypothetical protein